MQNQITQIENAIKDIDRVKHQLHQNSAEVKSQIQTNISRHLEALRNREVWLLNQVELLQSAKEEILHVQQARLNKQLGVAQLGKCDDKMCEKFDVSDLKPEENSYVTFRADSSSLRDNINSYGKVDVNGLPHSVFVQPGNPSTSLPRHFEEYDDAEHHILYKTVEEVSRAKSANSCIDVMVPRLSPRCEDWLAPSSTTSVPSTSSLNISLPVLSDQTSDWLKSSDTTTPVNNKARTPTGFPTSHSSGSSSTINGLPSSHSMPTFNALMTSASTQSWLKQIKHDFEDEDDFEIVEKSSSLGSDASDDLEMHGILVLPCSYSAPDMMEIDNKTNPWLLTDSDNCMSHVDNKTYDVFEHYFATQAREKTKWLADSNCMDTKMSSCSAKCQMKGSIDIENLGVCQTDNKMWLKTTPEEPVEVKWLCKANEPCSGFGECVSKPNCLSIYLQDKSSAESTMKNNQIYKGFDVYIGKPDSKKWLVNGGKNTEETKTVKCKMFDHILSSVSSDWLKKDELKTTKTMTPNSPISFDHIDKQSNGWLKLDTSGKPPKLSSTGGHNIPSWEYRGPTTTNAWLPKKEDIDDQVKKLQSLSDLHIQSADNKWLSSKPIEMSFETVDEKSVSEKNQDNSKWLIQSMSK